MSILADKLTEALEAKRNDINSFIWKGAKRFVNKQRVQEEIKLVDATPEQLQTFYNHCKTMLYNKDNKNPGRYVLLDLIKQQRACCNAELYLKYLEEGDPATNAKPYPRFSYFQALKTFLEQNKEVLPKEVWATTPITVISTTPPEYAEITIDMIYKACLDALGAFNKKHITNNFLCNMGLWFTPQEMKDLHEVDENGNVIDRLKVVETRLQLRNNISLHINPRGLSYKEFRAMYKLQSKKYSELTKDQLTILRDKILFKLEEEVQYHIDQWLERMRQLKLVAGSKGITLKDDEN